MKKILSLTYKEESKKILRLISSEMDVEIDLMNELTDFIYSLEEKEYQAVVIENNSEEIDILKLVRLGKDIRPGIPQIIMSDDKDKHTIGRLRQEGIFYNFIPPIDKEALKKIIQSALKLFYRKNK